MGYSSQKFDGKGIAGLIVGAVEDRATLQKMVGDSQSVVADTIKTSFSSAELTDEELGKALSEVFGVEFDSFDLQKHDKKLYFSHSGILEGYYGTVTYRGISYFLLNGVIYFGTDGSTHGYHVYYKGVEDNPSYRKKGSESFKDLGDFIERYIGDGFELKADKQIIFCHKSGVMLSKYPYHDGSYRSYWGGHRPSRDGDQVLFAGQFPDKIVPAIKNMSDGDDIRNIGQLFRSMNEKLTQSTNRLEYLEPTVKDLEEQLKAK